MRIYMKKSILAVAALTAILLTACGAANKGAAPEAGSKVTEQAAGETKEEAKASKDTRVIKMEYGDVEIPANPKRVVVAFFQGDLLALGIHPVGTSLSGTIQIIMRAFQRLHLLWPEITTIWR